MRWLARWHLRRGVAVLVIILVSLGLVAAFLQSVVPAMVDQFQGDGEGLPQLPGQHAAPLGRLPAA